VKAEVPEEPRGSRGLREPPQDLPTDHLSFPNPDSVLARRVAEERRRELPHVVVRRSWTAGEMRLAHAIPARQPPPDPKALPPRMLRALERLERAVLHVLESTPTRRVGVDALTSQSRKIAWMLNEAKILHDWNLANESATPRDRVPGHPEKIAIGPSLQDPKDPDRRLVITMVAPHVLRSRVRARQADLDQAQRTWDKVPADAPFTAWAPKHVALLIARERLAAAREEYGYAISGLPEPPAKHQIQAKDGAVLAVLHQLHCDYNIPYAAISRLLAAASLPVLTPRNIKRIVGQFRRP
jgi:hypothetical protein